MTFTLHLSSASGGAVVSGVQEESRATIRVAASDHPHGLVQFSLPEEVKVSEDADKVRAVCLVKQRHYKDDICLRR